MRALCTRREYLETLQRSTWGFEDIFQREGLSLSDEEVEDEFAEVAAEFGEANEAFDAERLREQIREFQKVCDT